MLAAKLCCIWGLFLPSDPFVPIQRPRHGRAHHGRILDFLRPGHTKNTLYAAAAGKRTNVTAMTIQAIPAVIAILDEGDQGSAL